MPPSPSLPGTRPKARQAARPPPASSSSDKMGSVDPLPYWHYNVPDADKTPECPAHLVGLSDKDRRIVGSPDAAHAPLSWPSVRAIVAANQLHRFQRAPSQLRRYRAFVHRQAARHGSVAAFVLAERLAWREPLAPRGRRPFACADDVKILVNDWPYGLDPRIVHLVVWTKFTLEADPRSGDLTEQARADVDAFVTATFRSRVAPENVRRAPSGFASLVARPPRPCPLTLILPGPDVVPLPARSCGLGTGRRSSRSTPSSTCT